MFFSTESWNSGGGGRSTARYKNGDTAVFISGHNFGVVKEKCINSVPRSMANCGL